MLSRIDAKIKEATRTLKRLGTKASASPQKEFHDYVPEEHPGDVIAE